MASLRLKVMPGSDLTPALLQSMSELRRGIMTMKPHINLAADFDKFAALCRTSEHTFLFYDADQQLAGMYLLVLRRGRTEAGKRYLLVFSEYAFMRKQYRANPALPRSVLLLLWLLLRQWRGESVWLSGIAYPTGHLLLEKFFGGLVLQGEANLSPMQTTLLDRITGEFAGASWDAVAGHVVMPTVPPRMSPMWQANVKKRSVLSALHGFVPTLAGRFWLARRNTATPVGGDRTRLGQDSTTHGAPTYLAQAAMIVV